MARTTSANYTTPSFPKASAGTDPFLKEDIQALAAAMDGHDHSTGKGLAVAGATIPDGSITSAKIADGTIQTIDIGNSQVTSGKLASGAAATNVGTLGGALTGTLPNPGLAALPANSVGASQITDLSVGTAELADGAVTSAKIADGTIVAGDLANGAVTNAKLASDTARANLLTNGGFEVWQRGNGPFTGNGVYTADRWHTLIAGNDTLSVSRATGASFAAIGGTYSAQLACTVGTGAGGTGFYQRFRPGDNLDHIRGRTVTLAAWVAANTASSTRLRIYTAQGDSATSVFHSGGGSYEWLGVTLAIPTTATDVFVGLQLMASAGSVLIDNAMLVVGSVPADYAPLHPADDLARCLRYYEVFGSGYWNIYMQYSPAASSSLYIPIPFKVQKAVVPTNTKLGTWNAVNAAQPTLTYANIDGTAFTLVAPGVGLSSAQPPSNPGTFLVSEANP